MGGVAYHVNKSYTPVPWTVNLVSRLLAQPSQQTWVKVAFAFFYVTNGLIFENMKELLLSYRIHIDMLNELSVVELGNVFSDYFVPNQKSQ